VHLKVPHIKKGSSRKIIIVVCEMMGEILCTTYTVISGAVADMSTSS
jgi:hypothetical protein